MAPVDRVDPELLPALQGFLAALGGGLNLSDIPTLRGLMGAGAPTGLPVLEGVAVEEQRVPRPEGEDPVRVRIYRPAAQSGVLPALLWIHGGGYVLGNVEQDDLFAKNVVTTVDCVVVSVDYRLAPEHPFPAPLEDCYAALRWLARNAGELRVDPARIAIGGASAGGGLAAGLALLARDRAEVKPVLQLLIYPMIDDRNVEPPSDTLPDTLLWSRENNRIGWRCYLGREPGGEGVPAYAAAFRAQALSGLPPAYIGVGELDLFLDENLEYAQRLLRAGVPTDLHVYPAAFHGFEGLAPSADVSRRFINDRNHVLKRVLHG